VRVSPAVGVEIRKALAPSILKNNSGVANNEPMQTAQHVSFKDTEPLPLPSGKTKETYMKVKCEIGGIKTDAVIDTGADTSMIPKHFGLTPTRIVKHKLKVPGAKVLSIGWIDDVDVSLGEGNQLVSMTDNFLILEDEEQQLPILGTPWIRRANAHVDPKKLELMVTSNGKSVFIPISVERSAQNKISNNTSLHAFINDTESKKNR
jgi:hypothetical protein